VAGDRVAGGHADIVVDRAQHRRLLRRGGVCRLTRRLDAATSFAPSRFRAFAPSRLRAFAPSRLRVGPTFLFALQCRKPLVLPSGMSRKRKPGPAVPKGTSPAKATNIIAPQRKGAALSSLAHAPSPALSVCQLCQLQRPNLARRRRGAAFGGRPGRLPACARAVVNFMNFTRATSHILVPRNGVLVGIPATDSRRSRAAEGVAKAGWLDVRNGWKPDKRAEDRSGVFPPQERLCAPEKQRKHRQVAELQHGSVS
jgi:hypothetical protein